MLTGVLLILTLVLSLFSVLSFARSHKKPIDRLESWMNNYQMPEVQEEKIERKGFVSTMGAMVEKVGIGRKISERTRIELIRADIPLTGYEFNIIRALIGIILGILALLLAKSILLALSAVIIIWVLASVYVTSLKIKRLKLFSSQLGDALTLFSNSLRAGFSFLQAVSSVAREMPEPVSKEFTKLLKEMSLGLSIEKALSNLLIRVPLDDLELLIMAILIQKEVGGNLAEIIDSIANTIRERITIQLEIKTLTAQGKMSGIIIGLLPVFLTIILFIMNPSYMSLLYTEPIGRIMVGLGLMSMMIGAFLINKIVKIEV